MKIGTQIQWMILKYLIFSFKYLIAFIYKWFYFVFFHHIPSLCHRQMYQATYLTRQSNTLEFPADFLLWSCHDDVIKWCHLPRYWPFVRGIHRWPGNSPHKGQWRWALMFSLICAWPNSWGNYRDAGSLRRHCAHYDATVMMFENMSVRRNDIRMIMFPRRNLGITRRNDNVIFTSKRRFGANITFNLRRAFPGNISNTLLFRSSATSYV